MIGWDFYLNYNKLPYRFYYLEDISSKLSEYELSGNKLFVKKLRVY
jgi:hypothetical protein